MANEITIVSERQRDQSRQVRLLFFYDIETPEQVGGSNVVPYPASSLTGIVETAATQAEESAGVTWASKLDAGTAGYEYVTYAVRPGDESLTNTAYHVARVRAIYASKLAAFLEDYVEKWGGRVGTQINAGV